jgi:hypothetical protein
MVNTKYTYVYNIIKLIDGAEEQGKALSSGCEEYSSSIHFRTSTVFLLCPASGKCILKI